MENMYGELEDFLDEINTHISQTPAIPGATSPGDNQHCSISPL